MLYNKNPNNVPEARIEVEVHVLLSVQLILAFPSQN